MEYRVLIVDDHKLVREGLKQILTQYPKYIVDECRSASEAIQNLHSNTYHLILLDISLPDQNGIETLKQIKTLKPDQKVCIISMHPEEQFALRAFKNGAMGYLTKNCSINEMLAAVEQILANQKYMSKQLANFLIDDINVHGQQPHELLSDREFEVFRGLVQGEKPTELANKLNLSIKTISTYKLRIMQKLNLENTAQLIAYAVEHKLAGYN